MTVINKKIITIGIGVLVLTLLLISLTSAQFWACFDYGEIVHYCDSINTGEPYKPDWTCSSSSGCEKCMSVYDEIEDCYIHYPSPITNCGGIPRECSIVNGGGTIDAEPPEFNLISPLQNEIYTSRSVLLEFSLDERADVYYLDLINGRGRWTRVCNECSPGDPAYSRERSFKEGLNELQFKAVDVVGNDITTDVSFFVDSKDPRISRTFPRKGFADGDFEVQFQEDNVETLILHYGIDEQPLNIENDCELDRSKYYCDTNVDLSDYDGSTIEYWFVLTDKAGNTDESKKTEIEIDTTFPVVNNLGSFYTNDEKYINFNVDITEENLDEVSLSYQYEKNGKTYYKERRLCSKLKEGVCGNKFRYKDYYENFQLNVIVEAGNSIGAPVVML